MWSILFEVQGDTFEIRGRPERRLPWIHVNDLAELFYLTAKHIDRAHHQLFHGTTWDTPTIEEAWLHPPTLLHLLTETLLQIRLAVAKYLGWTGKIAYTEPVTPFEKFINTHVVASPKKAQEVLGWEPKNPPFIASLDVTYRAWKAHQG